MHLKVGSVVRLHSGGPAMAVVAVEPKGYVEVRWFCPDSSMILGATLPIGALAHIGDQDDGDLGGQACDNDPAPPADDCSGRLRFDGLMEGKIAKGFERMETDIGVPNPDRGRKRVRLRDGGTITLADGRVLKFPLGTVVDVENA